MVIIINVITISMVINLIRYTYPAQQQLPVVVHDTVGQHDSDDNDDCAQVVVKEPQVVVQERVVIKEAPRPWASHRVIAITIIINMFIVHHSEYQIPVAQVATFPSLDHIVKVVIEEKVVVKERPRVRKLELSCPPQNCPHICKRLKFSYICKGLLSLFSHFLDRKWWMGKTVTLKPKGWPGCWTCYGCCCWSNGRRGNSS